MIVDRPPVDSILSLDYSYGVDFEWDPEKSNRCFVERGFDFEYAIRAFADHNRDSFADERWDYGEQRFVLRGEIDGRLFVVVFSYRGESIRIISARKANTREVLDHEKRKS